MTEYRTGVKRSPSLAGRSEVKSAQHGLAGMSRAKPGLFSSKAPATPILLLQNEMICKPLKGDNLCFQVSELSLSSSVPVV